MKVTQDCVCGEVINGVVLVELPIFVYKSTDATEIATFLKGLQYAHGLVLAHDVDEAKKDVAEVRRAINNADVSEALSIIAEFYSPRDWNAFVTVALVGISKRPDTETCRAFACDALRLRGLSTIPGAVGSTDVHGSSNRISNVFCLDHKGETQRLISHLRNVTSAVCEPLQSTSPLLAQYRSIRQQLSRQQMRKELQNQIESEVRVELASERFAIQKLQKEVHDHQRTLQELEEELQRRFEEEWRRSGTNFDKRKRNVARHNLKALAQTEKKASSRRCVVM